MIELVHKTIKRARVTVVEYMYMEELVAAGVKKSKQDGKNIIDDAVTQTEQAQLAPGDIDANIWSFSAKVLQGKDGEPR